MGDLVLKGATSGQITLTPTAVAGTNTLTVPAATDTIVCRNTTDTMTNKTLTSPTITGAVMSSMASSVITSGTALAYNWNGLTTNTVLDFTSIPSWTKRITVMFTGVSTNGSSIIQIQIGSGSITATGYNSAAGYGASAGQYGTATTGFIIEPTGGAAAGSVRYGSVILSLISSNTWASQLGLYNTQAASGIFGGGASNSLAGSLDRVRITTVNGTDTFDAGSVNILYE